MMRKIVMIEDDEDIRGLVLYALEASGYAAEGFEQGKDFFESLEKGAAQNPDGAQDRFPANRAAVWPPDGYTQPFAAG